MKNMLPLTVENVRRQKRFHPRCGSSFMILMLLIGILIGFFIPFENPFLRTACKLLCLPLVVSIGYELIKLCGRHDNLATRIIAAPGLWFPAADGQGAGRQDDRGGDRRDGSRDPRERRGPRAMSVRSLYNEARQALGAASDDPAFEAACLMQRFFGMDRAAVLTHGEREPDPAAEAEFRAAVGRRAAGEPLQYILGEWDFMALTLRCGPGVLIPRGRYGRARGSGGRAPARRAGAAGGWTSAPAPARWG